MTAPQSDRFGPGFNVVLAVRYPLGPMLQVGAEARAGGGLTLAPTVRYLQVIQPADPLSSRDARLMLFGLELSAFDARVRVHHAPPETVAAKPAPPPTAAGVPEPPPSPPAPPAPPAPPEVVRPVPPEPEPEVDRDHDQILDANDACPDEPEVINGKDDGDGCPDEGLIALEDDRIVLDARVLFDAGFARVKHAAWAALEAIAKLEQQHPECMKIRIEGHADARDSAKFNQSLSERRARNAMKHLIRIGVPADQLEAVGLGSSKPRAPGTSEEANQRNRRVEFVVVRESAESAQAAPPKHAEPAATEPAATEPAAAAPVPVTLPEVTVDVPAPAAPADPPPMKSGLRPIPAEKK